jgi:hypothetical protein
VVGFLLLSAEETEIVLGGGIEEPGYRPFPGSRREREEEDYFDEGDEEQPGDAPVVRHAFLERIVAAKHWRRSSSNVLLLVVRGLTVEGREPESGSNSFAVVGLARVHGGPRASAPGTRRMTIGPWVTVAPFHALDLLSGMQGAQHRITLEMIGGPVRELPKATGQKVVERLKEVLPDYIRLRSSLLIDADTRRPRSSRELQRRDAVATALRIFRQRWRSAEPVPAAEPTSFAEDIDQAVRGVENDYIQDDAAVFPGWERSARSRSGWWEFRSRDRRLLIKNINVSPAETRTGADLIYVRRAPDSVVLVQYKVLQKLKKTGELIFRPDGRLDSQVDRMLAFRAMQDDLVDVDPHEYRIGRGFTFVKFLHDDGSTGLADDELTSGYYIPSEIVRSMLSRPSKGPSGGDVHYVEQYRHIDGTTFVKLVQDSWIGSIGSATDLLRQTVGLLESSLRDDATIAVDEPI